MALRSVYYLTGSLDDPVQCLLLPFMKMLVCAFSIYSSEYIDDKIEEAYVVRMLVMAVCLLSFYLLV